MKTFALIALSLMFLPAGGCLMAATTFAPLGLKVVEATGLRTAQGLSGKQTSDDFDPEPDCNALERGAPYVAEVRTSRPGEIELRPLTLVSIKGASKWTVLEGNSNGAWRPESKIPQLGFEPPLREAMESTHGKYLVSAPTDPASDAEMKQSMAFVSVFAPRTGTYQWNRKRYEYSVTAKLPCFPADL